MSNLIPGNQKHLTLEDRLSIEKALSHGESFKNIARFLCKDPTTISKEVKKHRLSDWYHKGTFYNARNFCVHRYHCRKTNACGKLILCGIKCASCRPATRPAGISSGNGAAGWIRLLTSATAVTRHSTNVPLHTSMSMMPALLTGNTVSFFQAADPAST